MSLLLLFQGAEQAPPPSEVTASPGQLSAMKRVENRTTVERVEIRSSVKRVETRSK